MYMRNFQAFVKHMRAFSSQSGGPEVGNSVIYDDSGWFLKVKCPFAHVIYRDYFCCKIEKRNHYKLVDIFLIFAQNIDRGYTLEKPR